MKRENLLSVLRRICGGRSVGCKILPIVGNTPATTNAFTLVEVLIVIAVIIILAGLVLSTVGYVQKKGARARAETEISAMSAAIESYKADNAIYPRGNVDLSNTTPYDTDREDAKADGNPTNYANASLFLYKVLSGDTNANRQIDAGETGKSYFAFKPNMLSPSDQAQPVQFIRDPFGNSYGYSTANQFNSSNGYNPTFDLWSTVGLVTTPPTTTITAQWIKNW